MARPRVKWPSQSAGISRHGGGTAAKGKGGDAKEGLLTLKSVGSLAPRAY